MFFKSVKMYNYLWRDSNNGFSNLLKDNGTQKLVFSDMSSYYEK